MFKRKSRAHFFLLFPNIFNFKGGVQVYSRFLLETLQDLYPQAAYDVFLKYDSYVTQDNFFLGQTNFHCLGNLPRWWQSFCLFWQTTILGILQRPTLVITTHINYAIALYWLKKLTGIPYWVVVHGLEGWNLENPSLQAALKYADRTVAVSEYTRKRLLREQQLSPQQIAVLPNTFDAAKFQPQPKPTYLQKRYGLEPNQPIILTVTRLGTSATYKGYEQILQALVEVRKQIPNLHYLLVGKGDDLPRVQALVKQLSLTDCVTLTGFVPDKELCDHYNLCDVFALPSRGEGFGIVYLEALACGKPVLAGNRDGAIDPLQQGELGCLVNPEDVTEIATKLQELLEKTYPNALLFSPHLLRERTIRDYGLTQFTHSLANLACGEILQLDNSINYKTLETGCPYN
ncbi:MAG: glycosyltransferase [Spirulinaceae cyanobacterium]